MDRARGSFESLFGRAPEVFADAPGRVNLIGEHTDYNGGFVLPAAIPQRTRVALARRDDELVQVSSANVADSSRVAYALGEERPTQGWLDYVQGVTHVLRGAGHRIRGFDARIVSDVPVGSGLSSSAALEVSLLRVLREAFALSIDDVELARLGQRAENDFVGAPVGIMDQMASSLADEKTALFLDTRSLKYERVPLPANAEILVIDSGIAHDHATNDYRTRRAECERAAELLGVRELRDVEPPRFVELDQLPEPLGRRARHVVTENIRVLEAVDAMKAGALPELGALLDASHTSLRDDFEVSIPEIDRLVEIAWAEGDVYGARLTGGGFGGAIVALARKGRGVEVARRIVAEYASTGPRRARVLVPQGIV